MKPWPPHVTVATVVCRDEQYLLVEERDKTTGDMVFNQPAGHLEPDESLQAAALRETLEETGWQVRLTGVLGLALFEAPGNGITYYRTTFVAEPIAPLENALIDPDITRALWLSYEEILARSAKMRSPLVIDAIERHRTGHHYSLDLLH